MAFATTFFVNSYFILAKVAILSLSMNALSFLTFCYTAYLSIQVILAVLSTQCV
jgi:hypothetical protein